jgi:hypothetical protein
MLILEEMGMKNPKFGSDFESAVNVTRKLSRQKFGRKKEM